MPSASELEDPTQGWTVAHSSIPDILAGLPENLQDRLVDLYSVVFAFTGSNVVPAGDSIPLDVTLSGDYIFAAKYFSFYSSQGAAIATQVVAPPITVLLEDEGSNRKLSNVAIPVFAYFGTGAQPLPTPVAKLFSANSTVTATANNLDGAASYNLWLVLHGLKIFKQLRDGSGAPAFDQSMLGG
jgi:hypothetical protein